MIMRGAWILPVLSLVATLIAAPCWAQYGPPAAAGYPADPAAMAAMQAQYQAQMQYAAQAQFMAAAQGQGGYPPGAMAAAYMQNPTPAPMPGGGPPGPLPDAYGSYGSLPNGYAQQPAMDMQMPMGGPGGGGGEGCPYCGGQGCENCGRGGRHNGDHGLLGNIFGIIGPYPDGGSAAVRWYDFSADFMMLKRDDVGRNVALTSQGISGPIVLQTGDLSFEEAPSFRFSAAFQVGPGGNVEFTYFGLFNYSDSQFVRRSGDNDLFSVFSDFGLVPFNGFAETDQSDYQQISYNSTFDSFEVNYRQRWMAPNCRYQGSWLCGVRHFILDEKFRYFTSSSANGINGDPLDPAQARFDVDTTNNLTGVQIGGDMWICLLPGLRMGGEAKLGVYGNHMNANTTAGVNNGNIPTFSERVEVNDVSFIAQADLTATYRFNYQWTGRIGYQFLFVDGVALATENFNTAPPALFIPPPGVTRTPFINDNGNVFYHGWYAGLEFMW
jgi:hypothetical protein